MNLPMNFQVGRVTPCAPASRQARPQDRAWYPESAHGVTRPTALNGFRGAKHEDLLRGILSSNFRPPVTPSSSNGRKQTAKANGKRFDKLCVHPTLHPLGWGRSSVGRAPQWHCGGQGFESPRLHHPSVFNCLEAAIAAPMIPALWPVAARRMGRSRWTSDQMCRWVAARKLSQ